MSDNFTRDKLVWIEQIMFDVGLIAPSVRTGLVIAYHLNRKEGCARPSVPTMAKEIGVSENTVRSGIKALVARGHLVVEDGGGRNRANRYRILLLPRDRAAPAESECDQKPSNALKGIEPEKGCSGLKGISKKPFNSEAETLQTAEPKPFSRLNPNPLIEPIEEPVEDIYPRSEAPKPSKAKVEDEGFTEFWRVYPKKVAKAGAVAAWTKALKTADPDAIIAGAMRYAAERTGQDPTYTAHPATWLNKGRWEDEAAPARPPSAPAPGGGLTAKERTRAVVRHILASVEASPDGEEAA